MSNRNPKYINKVMLTKQKIADHEYTVLYDRQGNKYLKLEKFELKMPEPQLNDDPTAMSAITSRAMMRGLSRT